MTGIELEQLASTDAWFSSLPAELSQKLLKHAVPVRLEAGERLFARGDVHEGIFCIAQGAMRINYITEQGQEALLALLEAPHWFGEIALFDNKPRTHDAWAQTQSILFQVPRRALENMLEEKPQWWREFGKLITQKLRLTLTLFEESSLFAPAPRIAHRLAVMAGGHGSFKAHSRRELDVSQEQLGLMLSLSRQTVNQALKDLEGMGLIRRGRNVIEIIDLEKLEECGEKSRLTR